MRGVGDVNNDGVDDLAVGVTRYNPGGRPDQGGAFIYFGSSAFDATVDAVLAIPDVSVNAGASVAGGADVNGDGIADVVAGTGPGIANEVRIFSGKTFPVDPDGSELRSVRPFESSFTGGVFVG